MLEVQETSLLSATAGITFAVYYCEEFFCMLSAPVKLTPLTGSATFTVHVANLLSSSKALIVYVVVAYGAVMNWLLYWVPVANVLFMSPVNLIIIIRSIH
mgnify:CR=1 FL=1